jgi:hypothetical protein
MAEERKREEEVRFENKLKKESMIDAHLYGDKGRYITPSYRKKLEENNAWRAEQLRAALQEEDVTKKADLSDFHRSILNTLEEDHKTLVSGMKEQEEQHKTQVRSTIKQEENNTTTVVNSSVKSEHEEHKKEISISEKKESQTTTTTTATSASQTTQIRSTQTTLQTQPIKKEDRLAAIQAAKERFLKRKEK